MYKSALDNLGDSTFSQKAEVTNTDGVSTVDFYEENMKKYLELVSSKGYSFGGSNRTLCYGRFR